MTITLKFYSLEEKVPQDGEEIIYLASVSSFGYSGVHTSQGAVYYSWNGEGDADGVSFCYSSDCPKESMFKVGDTVDFDGSLFTLEIELDGTTYNKKYNDLYWTTPEEYWKSLPSD